MLVHVPQIRSKNSPLISSVFAMRQACAGVQIAVLCICYCFAGRCNPEQCKSLAPLLQNCESDGHSGGGDNIVIFCTGSLGKLAMRVALVEDIANAMNDGMWLVEASSLAKALHRGSDRIQSFIVPKFREGLRKVWVLRIISAREYRGGMQWRDEFSWKKMIFPPASSLSGCLACLQISSTVPVLTESGHRVANLNGSVQIGLDLMKAVDGSFKHLCKALTVQAVSTILVGYHLDIATMADSGHYHDAHEGNVLLSFSGSDLPEIRWHDFAGSYSGFRPGSESLEQALATDFAQKLESFSTTAIGHIEETHQEFATRLNASRERCRLLGQPIIQIRVCLRARAFSFVETILNAGASAMDSSARRKLLERVSHGMNDFSRTELWRQFIEGMASTSSVLWVRKLIRKDDSGTVAEDPEEPSFKLKGKDHALEDVDDLKKAIKKEKPNALKGVDADRLLIYEREGGGWKRITEMSTPLRQTGEHDCYGYLPPG
ncbi:unnamed protein product, partial [Symbiodinium sp. CCMP2456]